MAAVVFNKETTAFVRTEQIKEASIESTGLVEKEYSVVVRLKDTSISEVFCAGKYNNPEEADAKLIDISDCIEEFDRRYC